MGHGSVPGREDAVREIKPCTIKMMGRRRLTPLEGLSSVPLVACEFSADRPSRVRLLMCYDAFIDVDGREIYLDRRHGRQASRLGKQASNQN